MDTATVESAVPAVLHPYITHTPDTCFGRAHIAGSRVKVSFIYTRHLELGESVAEILTMYPHLTHAAVYDALGYYYDHPQEIHDELAEGRRLVAEALSSGRLKRVEGGHGDGADLP